MKASRSNLLSGLDVECIPDAPIGPMTWYGIGGRADMLVSPRTMEAAAEVVRRCRQERMPVRILGGGANLLVDDEGVDGVVLRLDQACFRQEAFNRSGSVTAARIGGGVDLFSLVTALARRGLSGFEHMAGIPGTVGGAVNMNAGGTGGDMGQALESVDMVLLDGSTRTFGVDDFDYDYRSTSLPRGLVTSVVLSLEEDDPIEVRDRVKTFFAAKKAAQPMADHSAGCAFKNPLDPQTASRISAGKLIDEAGLKGLSVGGASISTRHANFIVVQPGASSRDVQSLMHSARERVADHCGVELQREVVVWSRRDKP
ncbi:MAG: UDP-N-acetylmuramate dehydrogenase [Phycisphaerales bacterium]|nr:UDP-N-acetylmuramate dehydrogenase [Phycisphaerales bacterium]